MTVSKLASLVAVEVGYGDHRGGQADGGEGFGDRVAGAGEVGDADVRGELEVDGDYAGGCGGVVVGEDEAGVAYGAVAFGVGVVVGGLGGDVEGLRGGDGGGGVEEEVYGVGAGGLGFDGPVVRGLDVDVGGGGARRCGGWRLVGRWFGRWGGRWRWGRWRWRRAG